MVRLISRQRGGLAALKLTKLFGIDDFSAAKDAGKVLIIIIYCYLIIIIIINTAMLLLKDWCCHMLRLPFSHCVPLNPGAQLQLNPFTRFVPVPLFLQGLLAQLSISVFEDQFEKIKFNS